METLKDTESGDNLSVTSGSNFKMTVSNFVTTNHVV